MSPSIVSLFEGVLSTAALAQTAAANGGTSGSVAAWVIAVGFVAALVGGFVAGHIIQRKLGGDTIEKAEREASALLERSQKEASDVLKKAQEEARIAVSKAKQEFEKESRSRREELSKQENRLLQRESNIDKKNAALDKQEGDLKKLEKTLQRREEEIVEGERKQEALVAEAQKRLEQVAALSRDQAREELMRSIEEEARREAGKILLRVEDETRREADQKAREILAAAVQRYASEQVAERTVTVVNLPNDEMKGRIIGREGRNIRALEAATGIDVIIDDTPEAILVSGFNPMRREIARLSIEKLLTDGRIHPARIEEIVAKTRREVEAQVKTAGEQATFDLQIHNVHPELLKLVGKLKYFTVGSYNLYQHSIEVATLAGELAGELKANPKLARRAGLLHDIGKVADHDIDGSHAIVGAELARRFGETPDVVHAIRAHHEEEEPRSLLAYCVFAANAISALRPGARHEILDQFVKRIDELEKVAQSFDGVSEAYAIQAGREIRVIVEPAKISDGDAAVLAREIARKIETDMVYPGHVRVSVLRETRAADIAR